MAHIEDLGQRVELVSMDPHCGGISIALYAQGSPGYLVHSYSRRAGVAARLAFVSDAMTTLGDMVGHGLLRFPCGAAHPKACRRLFLEACKLASDCAPARRPLEIHDKKLSATLRLAGEGGGAYRLIADGAPEGAARRIATVAGGLVKLGEMRPLGDDGVAFDCGQDHDALIGMLLVRALNARAAQREQQDAAARGTLAAPSAQSI